MPQWLALVVVIAVIGTLILARHRRLGPLRPSRLSPGDAEERQRRNDAVAALRLDIAVRTGEDLQPDTTVGGHGLVTFNGIGFAFFGRSSFDVATESYLTTKWFLFVLPIIPVGRYRVIRTSSGLTHSSYIVIGQVPLRVVDWIIPVIWWAAAGIFSYAYAWL